MWEKEMFGRYFKDEFAKLVCKSKGAEGYASTDRNSQLKKRINIGTKLVYDRVYLDNNYVWLRVPLLNNDVMYVNIRRWNGLKPTHPDYHIGSLDGYTIETTNAKPILRSKNKRLEHKYKDGWDIYIDKHKNIMFVSVNYKVTGEVKDRLKESLSELLTEYKVIIVDNINSIQYL